MRQALVNVVEQITAAHTAVGEAIVAYNLVPDELKAWPRRV
jgi:hypothetical protein